MTLDESRQQQDLRWISQGREFTFGDPDRLPLTPLALARLTAASPGVLVTHDEGLTARVYRLAIHGEHFAVKQARRPCLVRNPDGETSFLNELRRHAELRLLDLPGIAKPLYGSLRHGIVVSRWIDGAPVNEWNERRLAQIYETGRALVEHGFFEWDFSPGNLLDDGERLWLFDFGYMYRFDPLRQFNSAGQGDDWPEFHLAERIETRNVFGWLLSLEQERGESAALAGFRLTKQAACTACRELRGALAARGAEAPILGRMDALIADWAAALGGGDLAALYLREGWRSHALDVEDDLRGGTCTPLTLQRCDWLIDRACGDAAALSRSAALAGEEWPAEAHLLAQRYREKRRRAAGLQIGMR